MISDSLAMSCSLENIYPEMATNSSASGTLYVYSYFAHMKRAATPTSCNSYFLVVFLAR